jgi:hypothetical protein
MREVNKNTWLDEMEINHKRWKYFKAKSSTSALKMLKIFPPAFINLAEVDPL